MPQNFPGIFPPAKEQLVNFNFADTSNQTGFVKYKGFIAENNVGKQYKLIRSDQSSGFTGSTSESSASIDVTTLTKVHDLDFDLSIFQLPQTLKGDAIFRGRAGHSGLNTGNMQIFLIVQLRKWDGSTETDIVSEQTRTTTSTSASATNDFEVVITIPQTSFKRGETLRMTVEVWSLASTDTTTITSLETDASASELLILIPYRLQT